jgi:hypothetical protein
LNRKINEKWVIVLSPIGPKAREKINLLTSGIGQNGEMRDPS